MLTSPGVSTAKDSGDKPVRTLAIIVSKGAALTRKIAVIGAGISGITVARDLTGLADVTMFEKSNELGGRMARRLVEPFAFDHGAQYFEARGQPFLTASWINRAATEESTPPDRAQMTRLSPTCLRIASTARAR